jgi:hypothetical protein
MGYVSWLYGVDVVSTVAGMSRSSDQNEESIRWAPMSPMAPTPQSVQPRQLKGW